MVRHYLQYNCDTAVCLSRCLFVVFTLPCLYCSHHSKLNSEAEVCCLEKRFLLAYFRAIGNETYSASQISAFGNRSPFLSESSG